MLKQWLSPKRIFYFCETGKNQNKFKPKYKKEEQ